MKRWIAMAVAGWLLPAAAGAATHLVRADGTGDFPVIQAAIDAAAPGDSVLLAPGVFRGPGNVDLDFGGKALTVCSQSGDPRDSIIDCEGAARGFNFASGEGRDTVVADLTVTQGAGEPGGAVRCWRGSGPTLRNCIFASNASPLFGGAVCCVLNASPLIVGCTFVRNRAGAGGAIACWTDSRPEIRDCLFLENSAASGGAIECADEALPALVGCTFRENQARRGGAVMVRERARATLAACTLCENLAEENGGGVGCETGGAALLERTLIAFGRGGGAIHCGEEGTATLEACNLFGNEGGDWRGAIAPQYIQRNNLRADPLFCDRPAGDLRLHPDSPCAPGTPRHRGGGLIGAWPVGCEP